MMFHNDYRLDRLIDQRQERIREDLLQPRPPSALRIRIGMVLIALGERLRGRAQIVTSRDSAAALGGARRGHKVLA